MARLAGFEPATSASAGQLRIYWLVLLGSASGCFVCPIRLVHTVQYCVVLPGSLADLLPTMLQLSPWFGSWSRVELYRERGLVLVVSSLLHLYQCHHHNDRGTGGRLDRRSITPLTGGRSSELQPKSRTVQADGGIHGLEI